jgi:hypothetical protein
MSPLPWQTPIHSQRLAYLNPIHVTMPNLSPTASSQDCPLFGSAAAAPLDAAPALNGQSSARLGPDRVGLNALWLAGPLAVCPSLLGQAADLWPPLDAAACGGSAALGWG